MSVQDVANSIQMDLITFYSVSVPVCVTSLLLNLVLVFCMVFPKQETERLKQPLNVLLGILVGSSITLQVGIFLVIIQQYDLDGIVFVAIIEMTIFFMRSSVSSSLWLNVFYYCQIVPNQRSVFIYLKRNIRFFMYSALIIDKVFFLSFSAIGISYNAVCHQIYGYNSNTTYTGLDEALEKLHVVDFIFFVLLWIRSGYSLLCLCVMSASSCATILYLQRHMKCLEESSSSSSSTRLQGQMRVTITGIIQSVLYFLCFVWLLIFDIVVNVLQVNLDFNGFIFCTILTLYSLGTTINLCIGQTIFRLRVAEAWQKCLHVIIFLSK